MIRPRLTWTPAVTCPCNQHHPLGANYYASVMRESSRGPQGDVLLAAGPYLTHPEALAVVTVLNEIVLHRYNPEGRASLYGFGTCAMPHDYTKPGKLNNEVAAAIAAW